MHVRLLVLALAFVLACNNVDDRAPAPAPAPSTAGLVDAASPRRPSRRYYMTRRGDRCEVYSVDGDHASPTVRTPCPVELNDGERIRLVGKTCLREGSPE